MRWQAEQTQDWKLLPGHPSHLISEAEGPSLLTTIKSVSTTTGRVDSAVLAIPVLAWPMFSTFYYTAWALRSITFASFSPYALDSNFPRTRS